MWSFAFLVLRCDEYAEAPIWSALKVSIIDESRKTLAVGIIDSILAAPPLPPVPSFINETVSPTEYPSPESIILNAAIVASETDETLTPASFPPPPVT